MAMDSEALPGRAAVPAPLYRSHPAVTEVSSRGDLDVLLVLEEVVALCGWLGSSLPPPAAIARAAAAYAGQPTGVLDVALPMPGELAADLACMEIFLGQVRAELDAMVRHEGRE